MTQDLFDTFSLGMRYWFIAVIAFMLIALIAVSLAELRERRNVMGEINEYIGYLEILSADGENGKRIGLKEQNMIGSSSSADIIFRNASLKRNHAVIARDGDKLLLTSVGGGKTCINGRRVGERTFELFSGDKLTFGDIECTVFVKEETDED